MFKKNIYYRIRSIHRNKKYSGSSFWDTGYSYTYTPIASAIRYIRGVVDGYNKGKKISQQVEWCVVKSSDEQECTLKFTGKTKNIEAVITRIFESDIEFTKLFAMESCPSYYI